MKNIFFILTAMLAVTTSFAQNIYKGKVTNQNNEPLAGAAVVSTQDRTNGVLTGFNGNFEMTISGDASVIISYVGFQDQQLVLINTSNDIKLTVNQESLDEVVVSASRERQKRSEVPGAISVITKNEIDEIKPLGIEQIVNQSPGVYMSSSKAASNEQHFTSVRSPISTKSLFLYIEDGLPIRPTAVFNHNALLEMNGTAFDRVEVLKGPASSIYGSEAIGGSFNFITKNPTKDLSGSIGFQINDLGLTRYEAEVSTYTNNCFGIYLGTHFTKRKNGPIAYSNYEKFAATLKTVYDANASTSWVNLIDIVDYRSDMTGSLSEADYTGGNFESDQTFTERDAVAFRFRSTIDKKWSASSKTTFNFVYRNNRMDQNPSYRIRQFRSMGQLTGFGSGEVNSNQFQSFMGLIQHKKNFRFMNSSLILGGTIDYSPQDYLARTIGVIVDVETGQNTDFTLNENDFILNYNADILNYAGYFQYEISPIEKLKITAALRYDRFEYNYDNLVEEIAGAEDTKTKYENLAPKLGLNFNFSKNAGVYANYSNGFTPPQTSTLFRNSFVGVGGEVFDLKPSEYDNYEIGGYFNIANKLKMDVAIYMLNGENTLVTLRDENDEFFNANAGETRSVGAEYGISFKPITFIEISHNGSYAKHEYVAFFDRGVDYSETDRETAPSLLGLSAIKFKPNFIKNFSITAEHELVGAYNTSFEGQVENEDETVTTSTYDGHNIFNIRASYRFKNFEIWGHALNVTDELFAVRASYNRFRGENSYTIGNPMAFHGGVKYNF